VLKIASLTNSGRCKHPSAKIVFKIRLDLRGGTEGEVDVISYPFDEYDLFHDKGEVKRLVESVIQQKDPEVTIDRLRKIDFSYIFLLAKKGKVKEVELTRDEINASVNWRRGTIDETLVKKIERAIDEFSFY